LLNSNQIVTQVAMISHNHKWYNTFILQQMIKMCFRISNVNQIYIIIIIIVITNGMLQTIGDRMNAMIWLRKKLYLPIIFTIYIILIPIIITTIIPILAKLANVKFSWLNEHIIIIC